MEPSDPDARSTATASYAKWRAHREGARWKQVLDVQRPYRWNLRRLHTGYTLDVGCGLGRNLAHLDGNAVGIDHNADMVAACRARGFDAFRPEDFPAPNAWAPPFDTLLLSHVVEHLEIGEAVDLVRSYAPHLRPDGRLVLIAPQEAGFRSDPTHVTFTDPGVLEAIARKAGFDPDRWFSFPFPRVTGRIFRYNEFVFLAHRVPSAT